ncbi:hypothetical protein BDZ97DRAFT_1676225, partial [Flammula alnicola]
ENSDQTLHLVHAKPSNWGTIMTHLAKLLNVPLVPYEEWFAHLENSVQDEDDHTVYTRLRPTTASRPFG